MRLVAEVLSINRIEGEERVDEYGFKWRKFKRKLKLVGRRELNKIFKDVPEGVKGKIVEQEVWLCVEPGYEWHFKTKIGEKPLLITLSEKESRRILEEPMP